jgi:chorismate mutase
VEADRRQLLAKEERLTMTITADLLAAFPSLLQRQQLAKEERLAMAITADLLAVFLSAVLLLVYTLQTGKLMSQLI